jgi:hypothetical protein
VDVPAILSPVGSGTLNYPGAGCGAWRNRIPYGVAMSALLGESECNFI